jgi:hypothetical protein
MLKIINRYKMHFQPLHMFRQIAILRNIYKELQVLTASKYTIYGFTVDVLTHVTILECTDAQNYKLKIQNNNTLCLKK